MKNVTRKYAILFNLKLKYQFKYVAAKAEIALCVTITYQITLNSHKSLILYIFLRWKNFKQDQKYLQFLW